MGNYHDDLLTAAQEVVKANEELTRLQKHRFAGSRQLEADTLTKLQGTIGWMAKVIDNSEYYLD